jgi:hypothetical protein
LARSRAHNPQNQAKAQRQENTPSERAKKTNPSARNAKPSAHGILCGATENVWDLKWQESRNGSVSDGGEEHRISEVVDARGRVDPQRERKRAEGPRVRGGAMSGTESWSACAGYGAARLQITQMMVRHECAKSMAETFTCIGQEGDDIQCMFTILA